MEGTITVRHPKSLRPLRIVCEPGDKARPKTLVEAIEWVCANVSAAWSIELALPVDPAAGRIVLRREGRVVSIVSHQGSVSFADAVDWLDASLGTAWEIEVHLPPVPMEAAPEVPLETGNVTVVEAPVT